MFQINVHDAKTQFSRVLARVQAGETVVVAKSGWPVAKIMPFKPRHNPKRRFGTARKLIHLSPRWNAPLSKTILDAFES